MVADASEVVLVSDAQTVGPTGIAALYARVLVLERTDFRVHGEANDLFDFLKHGHAPRKFETHRLVLFLVGWRVAALCKVDRVVLLKVVRDGGRVAVLVGALRVGSDGARLGPRERYLVVLEVDLTALLEERQVPFDLSLHLELPEHVQTHESAVDRNSVVRRLENHVDRVVEYTAYRNLDSNKKTSLKIF